MCELQTSFDISFRHDWRVRLLLPGLLLLHRRHLGHEESNKTALTLGRTLPARVLHRQRVERLHQEQLGLYVQLQLGNALCDGGHGIHLPVRQRQ